jgi:hypothetical protein
MHDRQSVTSCRVTDPAGNSPKSSTSFGAFDAFAALAAFVARAFALEGAAFFGVPFFAAFDFEGAAFLLAALPAAAFRALGAFFAAAFALLLPAAIT